VRTPYDRYDCLLGQNRSTVASRSMRFSNCWMMRWLVLFSQHAFVFSQYLTVGGTTATAIPAKNQFSFRNVVFVQLVATFHAISKVNVGGLGSVFSAAQGQTDKAVSCPSYL